MKTKVSVILFSLTALWGTAHSQCKDWKWPEGEQKALAEEKYVLQNDLVKTKQYAQAIPALNWLLTNTPNLQEAIYINGEKIYSKLADKTKDPDQKLKYADSLLIVLDMRMKYCPKNSTQDKKALYAFKYFYKDKSKSEWILELYNKNLEMNGAKMMDANVKYHMTAVQLVAFNIKNLSDEQILEYYDKLSAIATEKKNKKPASAAKYNQIQADLDEILGRLVEFDCKKTKEILGPKFEADPNDIGNANKIFKFMLQGKCTDDPLWLAAGKKIFEANPDFGLAKNIALKSKANGDTEGAEFYFMKASELATDASDKADMIVQLGHMDREEGAKSAARAHYREAISIDSNNKDPYSYIGNMYMSSYEQCKKEENRVKDRAVFLAAYHMFRLAGNTKSMNAAKEQFPSVGEIFELNIKKGDSMTVGCWINETVSIDTRD